MPYVDNALFVKAPVLETNSEAAIRILDEIGEPFAYSPLHELDIPNAIRLKPFRGEITKAQETAAIRIFLSDVDAGRFERISYDLAAVFIRAENLSAKYSGAVWTCGMSPPLLEAGRVYRIRLLRCTAAQSRRTLWIKSPAFLHRANCQKELTFTEKAPRQKKAPQPMTTAQRPGICSPDEILPPYPFTRSADPERVLPEKVRFARAASRRGLREPRLPASSVPLFLKVGISLRGTSHALDYDTKSHARRLKLLGNAERESDGGAKAHVILVATGGYEA